jgi:hypothetical protein
MRIHPVPDYRVKDGMGHDASICPPERVGFFQKEYSHPSGKEDRMRRMHSLLFLLMTMSLLMVLAASATPPAYSSLAIAVYLNPT